MSLVGNSSLAASRPAGKQQQAFANAANAAAVADTKRLLINEPEFRVASYVAHCSPQASRSARPVAPSSRLPFCVQLNNRAGQSRARIGFSPPQASPRRGLVEKAAGNNCAKKPSFASLAASADKDSEMKCSPRSYQQLSMNYRQQQQQEMSSILQLEATSIPSPRQFCSRAEPRTCNMGDRLSISAKRELENQDEALQNSTKTSLNGLNKYDCWAGDSLNNNANAPTKAGGANHNQAGIVLPAGKHLTPRLPRGVSKIPHQVRAGGLICVSPAAPFAGPDQSELPNKYLTFSKDQASSHFKSLREELLTANSRSPVDQPDSFRSLTEATRCSSSPNKLAEQQLPTTTTTTTTPLVIPGGRAPSERFASLLSAAGGAGSAQAKTDSPAAEADDAGEFAGGGAKCLSSPSIELRLASQRESASAADQRQRANQIQQQPAPLCEAFIMTGQSMMKLSCNESENNQLAAASHQPRPARAGHVKSELSTPNFQSQQTNGGPTSDPPGGGGDPPPTPAQTMVETQTPSTSNKQSHLKGDSRNSDTSRPPAGSADGGQPEQRAADCDIRRPRGEAVGGRRPVEEEGDVRQAAGGGPPPTTEGRGACSVAKTITNAESESGAERRLPSRIEPVSGGCLPLCAADTNRRADCAEGRLGPETAVGLEERDEGRISTTSSAKSQANGGRVGDNKIISKQETHGRETTKAANIIPNEEEASALPPPPTQNKKERFKLSKLIFDRDQPAAGAERDNKSQNGDLLPRLSPDRLQEAAKQAACEPDPETPSTPTSPAADRDAARRLAKRLYNLSGFKRSDVCHHLSKSNPFSQTVAEEYLKLFDFRSMKLDSALRKFLSKLQLNGETQERERLLGQFSQRFFDCNKEKYPSADAIQTLVCALILLNTDLHGGHHKKKREKLTLCAFVDGLNSSLAAGCQDRLDSAAAGSGSSPPTPSSARAHTACRPQPNLLQAPPHTFARHLLVDLYESIKKRPLKCSGDDKCDLTSFEAELDKIYSQQLAGNRSNTLPTRRFAPGSNAPSGTMGAQSRRQLKQGLLRLNATGSQQPTSGDSTPSESCIEFKLGYLNRKRVFEANGKPTGRGRRAWRRLHVSLKDLLLIMRPGVFEPELQAGASGKLQPQTAPTGKLSQRFKLLEQDLRNSSRIHHSFAWRSSSYSKREFVFHLRLADQSEFLFQANNEQDLTSWIDTINFASACLSAPALPNAIANCQRRGGSQQQKQPNRSRRPVRRPALPVSYTRLTYWEQLINHEERLQRLKVELDEHLAEAPKTMNANKRFKTEYIEKIAYLKQEIERYTVYVAEMRKKSNSPEAIILSNHPQIASLTPSPEMVLSLPSFAPPSPPAASGAESTTLGGPDDNTKSNN